MGFVFYSMQSPATAEESPAAAIGWQPWRWLSSAEIYATYSLDLTDFKRRSNIIVLPDSRVV
jgi:hypothetical protein